MSLPHSMPSLFGRFTAIWKDHDHLKQTLRDLKRLCSLLEDGQRELGRELEPRQLLSALRTDLREHFNAEESEGYFGTVLSEHPELEPEITALKSEHATMLGALDTLVQLATDPERWSYLPQPTRQLVKQLERHEGSESRLLREFFFGEARSENS